jgi:pantetheine-phosphate adenylyltransferase
MKTCIYPGSFDPCTLGHVDIIRRASNVFDRVCVAIGNNPSKKYTFSTIERKELLEKALSKFPNVYVSIFDGLLADFAYEQNIKTIIKGVRNNQDFDYERLLHEVSITQQSGIDTHILIADTKFNHVSSSAVRELCKHHGLIHEYVPYHVKQALEAKLNSQTIIGITGSIGCGKSYFTERLVDKLKYNIHSKINNVDLDLISHELYSREEPVYVELQEKIEKIFGYNPKTHRKEIGQLVFNDDDALKMLNEIVRQPFLTLLRKKLKGRIILLNGALLVEANLLSLCNNNVIVVNTSLENQIQNLKNRNLSESQIFRRINSQLNNKQKN